MPIDYLVRVLDNYQERAAIAAFDALNAQDPRTQVVDGREQPYELIYGYRMTERLELFHEDPSPALRLAARAQHLERWKIPRKDYPMDRVGYLKWRNDLKAYHANRAGDILAAVNVDQSLIDRVAFLLQKKQLKRDDETQVLEDVICQVFLEHYALEFAQGHEEDKVVDILRKTWGKMSDRGREAALELPLRPKVRELVNRALEEQG